MFFKASLDSTAKIITAASFLIFGGVVVKCYYDLVQNNYRDDQPLVFSLVIFSAILTLGGTFFFRIKGYSIDNNEFIIHRPANDLIISIEKIKGLSELSADDLRGTIRTFGNGGIFGYFGFFYNSKLRTMRFYATQRSNYILLELSDRKKIVITPDDPHLLINSLRNAKSKSDY